MEAVYVQLKRAALLLAFSGLSVSNIPILLYWLGDTALRGFLMNSLLPLYASLLGASMTMPGIAIFMREVRKEPIPPLFSWRPRKESFL
ncbi:hypothetical protein HRbin01_01131 [archaeon HR01]|nr:hypothetical protein HRbin01_01131 [archaeon HR01]